jgi:hypothetical protein
MSPRTVRPHLTAIPASDPDGEAFEVMIEAYWIMGRSVSAPWGFGMSGLTGSPFN